MKCIIYSKDAYLYQIITNQFCSYPGASLFFLSTVLLLTVVPREIEKNAYANFWMENKEFYGLLKKYFSLLVNFV